LGNTPLNDRLSRDELSRTLAAICALTQAPVDGGLQRGLSPLLAIAAEGTKSDAASVYLLDDEGAELLLSGSNPEGAALGSGPLHAPLRAPVANTLLGRVAHGECVRAGGADTGFGQRELALCPLQVHGRRLGVLVLARGTRPYAEQELVAATLIANQLASQLDAIRLHAEASRRVQDFSLMNELGELISGQRELPEILAAGVQQLARIVDVPNAFLLLLDESGTLLRTAASIVQGARGPDVAIPLDAPSAATSAFHERKPVVIRDPSHHPLAHRELARRQGHREVVAVPLVARGEALGAVVLGITDDRRRFTRDEVDRTVAVANQLAAAIASARIYHEERQRVRDLSLLSAVARAVAGTLDRDVLLSACLARICSVLGFDSGAAHVLDRETGDFTVCYPSATLRAGDVAQMRLPGLVERAALRAAPVIEQHEDAEGTLYACALPLLTGGGAVGVVSVGRRHRPISEAEASTLAAVAPEIAVGLENCRLFAEARVRVDELRLLLDVGRAVTASLDLHDILETSAGILTRMIDASNSFILLLDHRKKTLHGVAASNPTHREAFRSVRIPLEATSLAARCVRTRSPIAVTDAQASSEVSRELVALYGEKSLLALPMMVRDEPIGAVVIDDTRAIRHWRPPEIERAEVIAHQVAVAVSNARLFDDLKRSYGDLALAQEELVKRERLAALGELAAIMAHEVRNPVTVIFNSLGEMHKILRPTGDAAMLLSIVREEADRLNHLVGDLLEFAKPKQPSMQPESLRTVLEGAVEAATSEPVGDKVAVRTDLATDLPLVQIDARMMRRAFVNLVLNGLQAMGPSGTLTVRARTERRDGRAIARVDVIDTGPGIEPDVAPRMFQPFFTTKASGTGLGLAVVKSIVDAHRGELSVESHPGAGTTFTVRLPLEREPAA
jgi:signal transduction histidine kinase